MKIPGKTFDHGTVTNRCGNTVWEIRSGHMSATALFLVYPVFSDDRLDRRDIDFLSPGNKFTRNSANIFSTAFTGAWCMFNGLIGISGHLKGGALMPLLPAGISSGFLPKALALEDSVLILRGWNGTVIAILWMFVFGQLLFQFVIFFSQTLYLAVKVIYKIDQFLYLPG